jgi:transcriptional regulator with XRE-family HTH domain
MYTPQNEQFRRASMNIGHKVKHLRLSRNISLNELSKLSGVSKAALSKLEAGNSNPRVDTLDAIACALRLPLGDLLGENTEVYPYLEKGVTVDDEYSQVMKFRIGLGSVSEIWHLTMNPGVVISSPAHTSGTYEHILVHRGVLIMSLDNNDSIVLHPGDFYAFSGNSAHSYVCTDSAVSATVVMSYSIPS